MNPAEPKTGSTREQIAAWVAKRHVAADGGIQQVWFLRTESPPDEIRLLEVSERFTSGHARIEPVDFGLDVAGAKLRVLVADITSEQLERIKAEPKKWLPEGWVLPNSMIWGRRELHQ